MNSWVAMLWLLTLRTVSASPDVLNPSIVFIGDPHLNQAGQPTTWTTQTQWISDNVSAWNIQAVLCAGDFDGGTINGPQDSAPNVSGGWSNGWNTIDGTGLPYLMAVGNHDYSQNQPSTRDTTVFDLELGWNRIHAKSWYGDYFNIGPTASRANQYILVTVGTHNLLIMALECWPRATTMAWADGVVQAHLDREVIVITHGYMQAGGVLFQKGDNFGPSTYLLPGTDYAGVEIAAWAAKWPNNVWLILCGHYDPPEYFRRSDGRTYGIMGDYQGASPSSQTILIIAFSANSITINNYNTTTQTLDVTTYPPETVPWPIAPLKPTYVLGDEER